MKKTVLGATATDVETDTQDIQTRLPTGLVDDALKEPEVLLEVSDFANQLHPIRERRVVLGVLLAPHRLGKRLLLHAQ